MFLIAYFCEFHAYTYTSKTVGVPILTVFLGLMLGVAWELYQLREKQTIQIGWDDVLRTAIGSAIGGLLGTFLIY